MQVFYRKHKRRVDRAIQNKLITDVDKLEIQHLYQKLRNAGCARRPSILIIVENLQFSESTIYSCIQDTRIYSQQITQDLKTLPLELVAKKHFLTNKDVLQIQNQAKLDELKSLNLDYIELDFIGIDESVPFTQSKTFGKFGDAQEENAFKVFNFYKKNAKNAQSYEETIRWFEKSQEVREIIANCNRLLVMQRANMAYGNCESVEMSELIAEGNLILVKCIDKFDPTDHKFSTYLCKSLSRSWARLQAVAIERPQTGIQMDNIEIGGPEIAMPSMAILTDFERSVVTLKLGLGESDPMSDKAISHSLGTYVVNIENTYANAIRKLRSELGVEL